MNTGNTIISEIAVGCGTFRTSLSAAACGAKATLQKTVLVGVFAEES